MTQRGLESFHVRLALVAAKAVAGVMAGCVVILFLVLMHGTNHLCHSAFHGLNVRRQRLNLRQLTLLITIPAPLRPCRGLPEVGYANCCSIL